MHIFSLQRKRGKGRGPSGGYLPRIEPSPLLDLDAFLSDDSDDDEYFKQRTFYKSNTDSANNCNNNSYASPPASRLLHNCRVENSSAATDRISQTGRLQNCRVENSFAATDRMSQTGRLCSTVAPVQNNVLKALRSQVVDCSQAGGGAVECYNAGNYCNNASNSCYYAPNTVLQRLNVKEMIIEQLKQFPRGVTLRHFEKVRTYDCTLMNRNHEQCYFANQIKQSVIKKRKVK